MNRKKQPELFEDHKYGFTGFTHRAANYFTNSKNKKYNGGVTIINVPENQVDYYPYQQKSKFTSNSADKAKRKLENEREPLKESNVQIDQKKKTKQEVRLHGTILQKVDYSPRKYKAQNRKSSSKKELTEEETLQILADKYSKFLKEKLKAKSKRVQFDESCFPLPSKKEQNNKDNKGETIMDTSKKTLSLQPSLAYAIERPEIIMKDDEEQVDNQLMQNNILNVKSETETKIDIPSSPNSCLNDASDEFDSDDFEPQPRQPPIPFQLEIQNNNQQFSLDQSNETNVESDPTPQLQDLINKTVEVDKRMNETIDTSYIPPSILSPLNVTSRNNINNQDNNQELDLQSSKELSQQPMDPSQFIPKNRLFVISDSDSEPISEFSNMNYEPVSQENFDVKNDLIANSPILQSIRSNASAIESSILNKNPSKSAKEKHVTFDITNCPPHQSRINPHLFVDNDTYVNQDNFNEEPEDIKLPDEFESLTDFSKAIRFPKDYLSTFQFPNQLHNDENDSSESNTSDEDSNYTPNFSRILSYLRLKLDKNDLDKVIESLGQYKSKHFILSIEPHDQTIKAVYIMHPHRCYAKIIWGEGLTKVFRDDVARFYIMNMNKKRFQPVKATDFDNEVDAFYID